MSSTLNICSIWFQLGKETDSQRGRNLPKVTQLLTAKLGFWSQVCLNTDSIFFPCCLWSNSEQIVCWWKEGWLIRDALIRTKFIPVLSFINENAHPKGSVILPVTGQLPWGGCLPSELRPETGDHGREWIKTAHTEEEFRIPLCALTGLKRGSWELQEG